MSEPESTPEVQPVGPLHYLATMPRWKIGLVAGAAGMLLLAVVAFLFEDPTIVGTGGGGASSALVAGQEAPQNAGDPAAPVPWSEAFFRYGFSFFVGFAVGYASRAFSKFLTFLVGGLAIFLFLLSHYGFITVNWLAMDEAFQAFANTLSGQFTAFRSFITGSLPNAGLAGLGLFAGFKKNR